MSTKNILKKVKKIIKKVLTTYSKTFIINLQVKKTKQPSKPKALTNLKQYTCERYRDGRGNSQEDSLRVAQT